MPIDWDSTKSAANLKKHGVSFEDAANLLASDVDYLEIYDEQHSEDEDRFIAIGPSSRGVIVVVYTERDDNSVRIISARVATKAERERYEEHEKARTRR
jgi:uncharacterized DUF497 family protein